MVTSATSSISSPISQEKILFASKCFFGHGRADHSKNTYMELQLEKVHRYIVFKIDENEKEVIVEKTGSVAERYDDFIASFPEIYCRYAVYDFDYVSSEKCQKSKIFFVAWFRRDREGIHCNIQATYLSDADL